MPILLHSAVLILYNNSVCTAHYILNVLLNSINLLQLTHSALCRGILCLPYYYVTQVYLQVH